MRKRLLLKAVIAALSLVFFTLGARLLAAPEDSYKVGDKIASFTLKDDRGKTVKLSQFKGKVVVLNFYASW